jgi:hypothetical protein
MIINDSDKEARYKCIVDYSDIQKTKKVRQDIEDGNQTERIGSTCALHDKTPAKPTGSEYKHFIDSLHDSLVQDSWLINDTNCSCMSS